MRFRIILTIAIVAAVGWLAFSARGKRDAEQAERIARQMADINDPQKLVESQQIGVVRLNSKLIGELSISGDCWEVYAATGSQVALPYRPDQGPQQATSDPPAQDTNPGFVGAAACASCHPQRHQGFVQTAHHKTSSLVSEGSFHRPVGDESLVRTDDPNLTYRVTKRGDAYFQSIDFCGWNHQVPIQVVTGSAKAGQSYLYWHGDRLFQTHLSYLSATDEWIPSPGFTATNVDFTRVIRTGCLECHITYIHRTKPPNHYHRPSALWRISCERCHGPGRSHVEYHQQNPTATETKFITHPASLTRQQQLDICGQCHWGSFQLKEPAFSFRPGDDISDFHEQLWTSDKVGSIHTSNQLTRLRKSPCFQQTDMTCTTCHDPHQNQRGDVALFSTSCLKCHQQQHCRLSARLGDTIAKDCISCHMPISEDKETPLKTRRGTVFPSMVDHHIRIDHKATEDFLKASAPVESPR